MKENNRLYLKSLSIQNFATFQNQTINFSEDFNAIIGETGSGKSLIVDALQLIFGQRADKKFVRKGQEFSSVEAVFSCNDNEIKTFFHEIGHPYENDEIVVKRIIYASEGTKTYLNFQSCSLATLTLFAKRFIDLVGQFENQKLLSDDYQLVLLDSFCKHEANLKEYRKYFKQFLELKKELTEKSQNQEIRSEKEDYLRFQISEIEKLSPSVDEEQKLIEKKNHIVQFSNRRQSLQGIAGALSENDSSNVLQSLKIILNQCEKEKGLISSTTLSKIQEAYHLLQESSFEFTKQLDNNDNDETQLDTILDRLDLYQKLKRKFGGSTESILKTFEEFRKNLDELQGLEKNIDRIKKEILCLDAQARTLAKKIHLTRTEKAQKLSEQLTASVRLLRMQGSSITIKVLETEELGPHGMSQLEFLAETNPGDGYFKVKEIASGGELSRILLSLRQILSSQDSISIFLFDEIDTGIGGETALKIGDALKKVSLSSQVPAITHLPQIANFADKLIHVDKQFVNENGQQRTVSIVQEVQKNQKSSYIKGMTPL